MTTTDAPLYFVQISDTHLRSRDSYRRTERVIDHINRLPLDVACVVHTGDIMDGNIVDDRQATKAVRLFARLKPPIHFIPGNHDLLRGQPAYAAAYRRHFGQPSSWCEYGGVVFLFVDSSPITDQSPPEVAQRTFAAVAEQLRASGGKPVIVFHHEPCVPFVQPRRPRFVGGWIDQSRRDWEALLNAYRVKAVIAGHCHQGMHHWLGDVPLYVAPSVIYGRPDCQLFEYRAGRLAFWTLHVDGSKPLGHRLRDKLRACVRRWRGSGAPGPEARSEAADLARVRP